MVSTLAFALLPVVIATSCADASGSCTAVSGKSLLQSNSKNGIEADDANQGLQFQKITSFGSLTQNSKEPANSLQLLGQLQARTQEVVSGGKPLTDLEKNVFQTVNETLANTTLPALTKGHDADQATMNGNVKAVATCNENLETDSKSAKGSKQVVDAKGTSHRFCRGNQSELKTNYNKSFDALKKYAASIQQPQQPASTDLAKLFAYFETLQQWFNDTDTMYTQKNSELVVAKTAYENKTAECNTAQQQFESNWCQWIGQAAAASKSYNRCWGQAGGISWNATKAAVMVSANQRKIEYVAVKKIQCFLAALFLKEAAKAKQHLAACQVLAPDTTMFDLVNTDEPNRSSLAGLGDLQTMPGTSGWETSVYAGLEGVQKVLPCAKAVDEDNQSLWKNGSVTHLCGDDEHVRLHRCEKCEAGKGGGGNAVGEDTSCSAILCKANQHVVGNSCKPCPSGQTNDAGDDASKGDTSCDRRFLDYGDAVFLKSVALKNWVSCSAEKVQCQAVGSSTCPDVGDSKCVDSGERLSIYNSRGGGPFYNGDVIWLKWSLKNQNSAWMWGRQFYPVVSDCLDKESRKKDTGYGRGCYGQRFRIYNSADSVCQGWACKSFKLAKNASTLVDWSRKISSGDVVWLQADWNQNWYFCGVPENLGHISFINGSMCSSYRVHKPRTDPSTQFQIRLAH